MATATTLTQIPVNIPPDDVRKIKPMFPDAKSDGEAIASAVHDVIAKRAHVTISHETLRELAARAGSRKPIRSEDDLVKAFECVTGIDKNSCIVHLEAAEIPQIAATAVGQKMPLGEAIVQYLLHAIAQGWFSERIEVKHIMFQSAEFKNLAAILGVPVVRGSEHLIKLIMGVKKRAEDAETELRAAKDAQESLAPESESDDPEHLVAVEESGDLSI